MSFDPTYEQYRERLVAWIAKNAQRKIMEARREERDERRVCCYIHRWLGS